MTIDKKYKGAPFGTQSARFDVGGIHPKLKMPGTFFQPSSEGSCELGPGKYDVDQGGFSAKAVSERAAGPGWARSYYISRQAAMPHLLYQEQWKEKQEQKRKLGPGTYDLPDPLSKSVSMRGMLDLRETRFKEKYVNAVPGPGTYEVVNHDTLDKKPRSKIGLLDSGAKLDRSLPSVGSSLAPGTYEHVSFADQIVKKQTGKRGPYDVFSIDRNKPIMTGHYAKDVSNSLGPGQYKDMKTSFIDDLNIKQHAEHGRFGKIEQYPKIPTERIIIFSQSQNPRDPADPGPGHYAPKDHNKRPSQQADHSPPFHSSAARADKMATKFFTGNFNPVGPGRYDIQKWQDHQHINSHQNDFKSRIGRPDHKQHQIMQERIRGKDLRKEDIQHLIPLESSSSYRREPMVASA